MYLKMMLYCCISLQFQNNYDLKIKQLVKEKENKDTFFLKGHTYLNQNCYEVVLDVYVLLS